MAKEKDSVSKPEQTKETKKDDGKMVLFSIFPEYEIGVEAPHETKHMQDGHITRIRHNGKKIEFKNHKAKVSKEVADLLFNGKKDEHGDWDKEPNRKANVTFWNIADLRKKLFDPKHRRWARKFRDDVERRNGMHNSINDAYFTDILDNPRNKIGGVVVAKA